MAGDGTEVTDEEVDEFRSGCVQINSLFLSLSERGLMEYRDHWPKRSSQENLAWIGRDKTCRRKFRRILEGLDEAWPVHEQAAYLLRAFSGLQIFPDANHRTGLVVVAFTVDAQGHRFSARPEEMVRLVESIRPLHGALSARRTVDRIAERDASFHHIAEFMERHVRRLGVRQRLRRLLLRESHLRDVWADIPLAGIVAEQADAERVRKRRHR